VSPKRRGRFSKTCFTYFTGDDKRSEAAGLAAPSGLQQSNGLNNFDRDSISSLLRELLSRRKEDFEVPPPPIFFQVGRIQGYKRRGTALSEDRQGFNETCGPPNRTFLSPPPKGSISVPLISGPVLIFVSACSRERAAS